MPQSKCRSWWGKCTVYKAKIFILSKSTNRNFINSHLPWVKYFIMITLKSDIWSEWFLAVFFKLLKCDLYMSFRDYLFIPHEKAFFKRIYLYNRWKKHDWSFENDNRYVKKCQKCPKKSFIIRLESWVLAPSFSITSSSLLGIKMERLCMFSHTWLSGDWQMLIWIMFSFLLPKCYSLLRRVKFCLQHPNTYIHIKENKMRLT